MGAAHSSAGNVREMAQKILSSEEDDQRVAELRERLTFLHTMANTALDAEANDILRGQEGDLKTHVGTVVEVHKRVKIKHGDCAKKFDEVVDATMDDGLRGVFSDRVKGAIGGRVKTAIATFFCNDSVGEGKQKDMIVVWDNNALLRVDFFLWRYNFSTPIIVEHVDSVFAYVVTKRVIDLSTVSPAVISDAISLVFSEDDGKEMLRQIDYMTKIVGRIKRMHVPVTTGKKPLKERNEEYVKGFQLLRASKDGGMSTATLPLTTLSCYMLSRPDVLAKTKSVLTIVKQAVAALESDDDQRGYELLGEMKRSSTLIIQETQYLLDRVSVVEKYYREQEHLGEREIDEVHDMVQATKQEKDEKICAKKSKEADILQAKRDLRSAEDDRRRARKHIEETENRKPNLIRTILTNCRHSEPNAIQAREDEERAERDIHFWSSRISQCEREIVTYVRDISQLDSQIDALLQTISMLKAKQESIHVQRGEMQDCIGYVRDMLNFWREISQLTEHGMECATLIQRLSTILKLHNKDVPQPLQSRASTMEKIEMNLERGSKHLFSMEFTCHYCHGVFHNLPHLSYGNFCCIECYKLNS